MSDIDILLFHEIYQEGAKHSVKPNKKSLPISLETEVIHPLTQQGIIACSLSSGATKWQGIARIPSGDESFNERLSGVENIDGRFKRLDISLAPNQTRGAALLSLTGDVDFNRHLRLKASEAGMQLNEYGLWATSKPLSERESITKDDYYLCPSGSEEIILQQLGLEYVEPGMRNFSNLGKSVKMRSKKESFPE